MYVSQNIHITNHIFFFFFFVDESHERNNEPNRGAVQ